MRELLGYPLRGRGSGWLHPPAFSLLYDLAGEMSKLETKR